MPLVARTRCGGPMEQRTTDGMAMEAGKAIVEMPQILFFPFLSLIKLVLLFVYFVLPRTR